MWPSRRATGLAFVAGLLFAADLAIWNSALNLTSAARATLLASRDGGVSWEVVTGLTDHPSRPDWHGGAAG